MIMFIASEVMFFVAWFWAYFEAALYTADPIQATRVEFTGGVWPPKGIESFDPWHLPLLNTLILLTSGTTVTWAHHALLHGDRKGLKYGLWLTIILGVLFTACQAYEYAHAHFGFSGSIYSATFFMATGFHGAHVIIGTIFLAVCLLRTYKGDFTPKQHLGFEFALLGTGTSSTWCGCSCSPPSTSGAPAPRPTEALPIRPPCNGGNPEGRREPPFLRALPRRLVIPGGCQSLVPEIGSRTRRRFLCRIVFVRKPVSTFRDDALGRRP